MPQFVRIWVIAAIIVTACSVTEVNGHDNVTSSLYHALFREHDYRPELLPVCSRGQYVHVQLDVALRQIISLDEKAQILHTNVWIRLRWPDCRLAWNVSQYGGIDNLVVPYANVWTPDLALYDSSAEEEMMPGRDKYRAQIAASGNVTYNFPTVLASVCIVKVTYFPFDVQNCSLQFSSWSHSLKDIDIHSKAAEGRNGDLSAFVENNEWEVVKLDAFRYLKSYDFGDYPDVRFFIIMRRRPQFYIMTMLFPCILVSAIATIGFLLPAESGEKVSLEVTVLLSLAVFLLVISDFLPPSAERFPVIGTYFASAMLMVSFSLVLSVLVLNVHHRGENGKEVPAWARRLFLEKIGRMCIRDERRKYRPGSNSGNVDNISNSANGTFSKFEMTEDTFHQNHGIQEQSTLGSTDAYTSDAKRLIRDQTFALRVLTDHLKNKDRQDEICQEWRALSRIIDRLLLLVYVLLSVIVTLVFLLPLNSGDTQ